jgi:hypothetical protein
MAASIEPKDEFLRKRWSAVEEVCGSMTVERALNIVRLFYNMRVAHSVATELAGAVQKHDTAFVADSREQELSVLAGAVLACILTKAPEIGDLVALAVTAYNCQGAGAPGPVPEIVQLHQKHWETRSGQQRTRVSVPDGFTALLKIEAQVAKMDAGDPKALQEAAAALRAATGKVNQLTEVIAGLQVQQQHFREESDVLWWVTGGYSRDLGKPLTELPPAAACIVAGKELADLAVTTVGPFAARAFLHKVVEGGIPKMPKQVQLSSAIDALDPAWGQRWVDGPLPLGAEDFCPVAMAIREAVRVGVKNWAAGFNNICPVAVTSKLSPVDLAYQAYTEALLHKASRKAGAGR